MDIIVTDAAGFIGYSLARRLLESGHVVLGVDNFVEYYDPQLKRDRVRQLSDHPGFQLVDLDIAEADQFATLVRKSGVKSIVHLAAQAGVRYSLQNAFAYERSNLAGHLSVLEAARHCPDIQHLVYGSSSSVYGDRTLERPTKE